jgi:hypothetical protein
MLKTGFLYALTYSVFSFIALMMISLFDKNLSGELMAIAFLLYVYAGGVNILILPVFIMLIRRLASNNILKGVLYFLMPLICFNLLNYYFTREIFTFEFIKSIAGKGDADLGFGVDVHIIGFLSFFATTLLLKRQLFSKIGE